MSIKDTSSAASSNFISKKRLLCVWILIIAIVYFPANYRDIFRETCNNIVSQIRTIHPVLKIFYGLTSWKVFKYSGSLIEKWAEPTFTSFLGFTDEPQHLFGTVLLALIYIGSGTISVVAAIQVFDRLNQEALMFVEARLIELNGGLY